MAILHQRRYARGIGSVLALTFVGFQFVAPIAAEPCVAGASAAFVPGAGRTPINAHGPDLIVRNITVEVLNRHRVDGAQPVVIWAEVENIGDEVADPVTVHLRYREYDSRAPYDGEWIALTWHALDGAGLLPGASKQYPLKASLAYHVESTERYSQVIEATVDRDNLVVERCGTGETNNQYTETLALKGPSSPTLMGFGI